MSAFFVSNKHMQQVVALLRNHPDSLPETLGRMDATEAGRALFEMNAEAIRQRYGDDPQYEFTFQSPPNMPRAHRLRLLDSLHYQCCEGTVPQSQLYKDIEEAMRVIHADLSPAEKAKMDHGPWSI